MFAEMSRNLHSQILIQFIMKTSVSIFCLVLKHIFVDVKISYLNFLNNILF